MNRLKKWSKEIIVLAIILFIAFTVMDLWRKPQTLAPVLLEQHTLVNGESVSLAELSKEKPILVYFWATWCGVCNLTSPTVSELSQSGMPIISVAIRSGETSRLIKGMENKELTFPVINDTSGQLSNAVGISATPTFMVIDNGELVSFTSGWTSSYGLKMRMWLASF
ncbi:MULTISPECIES: protein disulfide oxidoreductase [Providencia]|uniref:Protein disulfide oxidoreductase n=1 Tax=Providencia huaxiensis TaxID=2027290 RepID=A0ABU2J068_9GAMM|nr:MULTISPECIES: protein disulfide oxidoreductase [Providencia]MBZ3681294.1 protein disulfide oxidoreductase [Providencia rettgeri]MDT0134700.1 protein disulfide oxidoreductase [Providencia huaxiensis]MDT1981105.1 protein disulfide oxidoreductase [Providencia huaxiensis]QLR00426.1 protein disulfide oxidoreductase [Providencia rettgeri]